MKFSLVIPCYNEAANLPLLVDRCQTCLSHSDVEIILIDNGSSDDSPQVMENLLSQSDKIRSVRVEKNRGYGFGIISGLNAAEGDVLGWTHADMQTDPQDFLCGMNLFHRHGNDIFVKGRRKGRPFADVVFTVGMSLFETLLLSQPMWDINAQPTMFSRHFFETWNDPPHDFSLDLYAYYQAHMKKLGIHRFPVKFGERAHGVSHWNVNWTAKKKFIQRTIGFSLELKRNLKT